MRLSPWLHEEALNRTARSQFCGDTESKNWIFSRFSRLFFYGIICSNIICLAQQEVLIWLKLYQSNVFKRA